MQTIMIEYQILQGLVNDEEYTRQVMPFVKEDYFTQLRLKYVAYSRGKHDCWTISTQDKFRRRLGER